MRFLNFVVLLIAAVALSISGCKKDKPKAPTGGGGGGGGSTADCCLCEVDGTDYVVCEDDFTEEDWNQVMEEFDCDCSPNSAGYICDGGCFEATSGADYNSYAECEDDCGGSSGECCDCSEVEFLEDEYCDGEFEMGGASWEEWIASFESLGCNCN